MYKKVISQVCCVFQDGHQEWNGAGVPGPGPGDDLLPDPGLNIPEDDTESAEAGSSNCDQKENSSSGDTGDPVARAIEQRSYRYYSVLELIRYSFKQSLLQNFLFTLFHPDRLIKRSVNHRFFISELSICSDCKRYLRARRCT